MDSSIRSFLEDEVGLTISRVLKSGEYIAFCPLHDDNDASLYINPTKGMYHCFSGCLRGSGGLQKLFETLRPRVDLNSRFMAMFPVIHYSRREFKEEEKEEPSFDIDIEALPLAVNNEYLSSRWISDATVHNLSIKYHKSFDAVIIPLYMNHVLKGYVRRNISSNPKYLNSTDLDRSNILFPYDHAECDKSVILVEGVFDALNAHDKGLCNVVSTLGGLLSEGQIRLIGNLARTVVICPDRDTSGIRMAERNAKLLQKFGFNVEFTLPPRGYKDFGAVKEFGKLETWSYWYLRTMQKDLQFLVS